MSCADLVNNDQLRRLDYERTMLEDIQRQLSLLPSRSDITSQSVSVTNPKPPLNPERFSFGIEEGCAIPIPSLRPGIH